MPEGAHHVGLISDTHGRLRPEVFPHFQDVELILHAGDIGDPGILVELEALAPVRAVWGNTDGFEVRARVPEEVTLEVGDRRIVLLHGHQVGSPTAPRLAAAHPEADIVIYGHTHRPAVDRIGPQLMVNPGSAGPQRFRIRPSVAVLVVRAQDESVELIEL